MIFGVQIYTKPMDFWKILEIKKMPVKRNTGKYWDSSFSKNQ